jgi:hypothetical protein
VSQTVRDVDVLFTVLHTQRGLGSDGNSLDHLEAPGDIGERVLQAAAKEAGFCFERFTGQLALGSWGRMSRGRGCRPDGPAAAAPR